MEKVEPEPEGILANDEEEDDLENCELVEEVCSTSCDEEPGELSHDSPQIVNIQDLGSDHAADPDGGDPHDGGDHLVVKNWITPAAFFPTAPRKTPKARQKTMMPSMLVETLDH